MKKLLAVLLALVLCLSVSAVSLAEAAMTGRYIYPEYCLRVCLSSVHLQDGHLRYSDPGAV